MLSRARAIFCFAIAALAAVNALASDPIVIHVPTSGEPPPQNLTQSQAQHQAAQNYIDQSNAAFAQAAMAMALGLSGMKKYCNPSSGSNGSSVTGGDGGTGAEQTGGSRLVTVTQTATATYTDTSQGTAKDGAATTDSTVTGDGSTFTFDGGDGGGGGGGGGGE